MSDTAFDAEPDQHHVVKLSACMSDFRMDYSPFFEEKWASTGENKTKMEVSKFELVNTNFFKIIMAFLNNQNILTDKIVTETVKDKDS